MTTPFSNALPARKPYKGFLYLGLILLVIIVFGVLIHFASRSTTIGADYYTFWVAGRAAFFDHLDPYSQEVTAQIQMGKLGRLVSPKEDQMAFAYPPYSLFIILPTLLFSFDWATSFWLASNIIGLLSTLFLITSRNTRSFALTVFLFFPVFLNLVLGTFDIMAAVGILLFFGVLIKNKQAPSLLIIINGIFLAWATMKPQFIWLVIPFILLYAIREKYWLFLKTFLAAFIIQMILSFLLLPEWVLSWINQVQAYAQYVNSQPTITEFLRLFLDGEKALFLTGILFVLFAGAAFFLLFRWWNGRLHWLKVAAWLCLMTYLFHLHGISYEQLIFILPLFLWIVWRDNWKSPEILFFWGTSLVISWLAFAFGTDNIVIDRTPVLWNLIWVGYLLRKPGFQL